MAAGPGPRLHQRAPRRAAPPMGKGTPGWGSATRSWTAWAAGRLASPPPDRGRRAAARGPGARGCAAGVAGRRALATPIPRGVCGRALAVAIRRSSWRLAGATRATSSGSGSAYLAEAAARWLRLPAAPRRPPEDAVVGRLAFPRPSSRRALAWLTRRQTRSRGCRMCPQVVARGAQIKSDGVRAVVARRSAYPGSRALVAFTRDRGSRAGSAYPSTVVAPWSGVHGERRRALAAPTHARAVARVPSMPPLRRRGPARVPR